MTSEEFTLSEGRKIGDKSAPHRPERFGREQIGLGRVVGVEQTDGIDKE